MLSVTPEDRKKVSLQCPLCCHDPEHIKQHPYACFDTKHICMIPSLRKKERAETRRRSLNNSAPTASHVNSINTAIDRKVARSMRTTTDFSS